MDNVNQRTLTPDIVARDAAIALEQGQDDQAVRLIVQAVDSGSLPGDSRLPAYLSRKLGQTMFDRVIETLATYGCFYCQGGLNSCESCNGTGWSDDGEVCDTCLGLGKAFCEFCSGSGWATINFMPMSLRLPVVVMRLKCADKWHRDILVPGISDSDIKSLMHQLVGLNRVLGVLESAVVAVKESIPVQPHTQAIKKKIVSACVHEGGRARLSLLKVLNAMRRINALKAQQGSDAHAQHALRRAKFYFGIAGRSFRKTSLEHPFLPLPPARKSPARLEVNAHERHQDTDT